MTAGLKPGETFAGYRIEEMIGRGGMGVVFRASDLSLDRPVALKLIAPEFTHDERFRQRFLKEPRLAAALDHPNVVPIYEAREHDGQLYLAMRFVPGEDLKTRIARRDDPLAPEQVPRILGQIADALDAAHRRGLIHRDVKPANVLLDDDGHAYLTDFGITKQLNADTTASEQVVGTLDYIAPERIRGGDVDGRSDVYSLACVLYECLTGTPPFRRDSQAEAMWAHLQSEIPRVDAHPDLDPVFAKGLAKEPKDRYATCSELIDDARAVLTLPAVPGVRSPRARRALLRRRHAILAAGIVVLAGAIAAGIAALGGDGEGGGQSAAIGSGVAAIDPRSGDITALAESRAAPSNVAVGAGGVWVLNTNTRRVTRIDPETKRVTASFEAPAPPTDLAAGEGAVWLGTTDREEGITTSVSRIDPDTRRVTYTLRLPDRTGEAAGGGYSWGIPQIAVGGGAVWAHNPDETLSRIDAATGRQAAVIEIDAGGLAAGREGVWLLDGNAAVRIDPSDNKPAERIEVGSPSPSAIAVGGGYVWVVAEQEGLLWRIEPGPTPVTRSTDVGIGATYVAFGAGSAWTANFLDGTVTRVDPATAAVKDRTSIGAPQSLAAGAGFAWVSTAGAPERGQLPASVCGELFAGGRTPDVLIASDLPLQGFFGGSTRAMEDAIRLVLTRRDYRAGRFDVGYRSCDDSTAQTGAFENRRCAANANAYARAEKLVAVIGPFNSDCAAKQIPILNRAPGGPLAMISPTNTDPGLTTDRAAISPPDGLRNQPDVFYPTKTRNYMRLLPTDDLHGSSLAVVARDLDLEGVFVVDDGSALWRDFLSKPFQRAADRLDVPVVGSASFDPRAKSMRALVQRIAAAGADGVVLGGDPYDGADRVVKALRARLGRRVTIMAGFFFGDIPGVLERLGRDAHGIYVGMGDHPQTALGLTEAGERFAREIGTAQSEYGVLEGAQAAEIVMDAIARSDGTRASVLREMQRTRVQDGIMGSFAFDRNGDITTPRLAVFRITGSTPPSAKLPENLQGAVVDRVVVLSPGLY